MTTKESPRLKLDILEARFTHLMVRYSIAILRIVLGFVFLGFGVLKFFPGVSPIEALVMSTIDTLTFGVVFGGVVPVRAGVVVLAALECVVGLGLITGKFLRLTLALLGFQLIGALSPLLLFTGELFSGPYRAPTLEGQYVIKDVVLVSAGLVICATMRGARMVSEQVRRPEDYRRYQEK